METSSGPSEAVERQDPSMGTCLAPARAVARPDRQPALATGSIQAAVAAVLLDLPTATYASINTLLHSRFEELQI